MQLGRRQRVRAGSGCAPADPNFGLFSGALNQNASANGRILMPPMTAPCVIRDIQVVSLDSNIWEFWFFSNSLFATGDAREAWRGTVLMAAAGTQIGAAGLAHAQAINADIFYEDDDAATMTPPVPPTNPDPAWRAANGQTGTYLNVSLINRSAGAKTNAAYFDVTFVCEPVLGW